MFVVDQVVRLAGGEDGAVADDVGSVADAEGFAYVVVGNEYADATRFEEVDDFLDVDDGDGVNAGEGFVQEDEARLHVLISKMARMFCSTVILRKIEASWGR